MPGRVAITGIGCVSSLGSSATAFADALAAGRCGVRSLPEFDGYALRTTRAARVTGFDPSACIPPLKLRRIDEVGRITIGAALEALESAGLARRADGFDDVGVALGSFTAGVHASAEYLQAYLQLGAGAAPALLFSNTVGNAPASVCALDFGLRGPNATLMHKEASGLAAVEFAARVVRRGSCPAMLAGGADVLELSFFRVHDSFKVMAPDDEPSRPFDAGRRGFLLGEGAFLFLLEDEDRARARGAAVRGIIRGVATSGSSERLNEWPAEPDGMVRAMRDAIDRSDVRAADIDVVYAAANGSGTLDRVESAAIGQVFGEGGVAVTAIKGALGESGASSAAALAAALLLGARGCVPPTVGLRTLAADCPVRASCSPRPLGGPLALLNSVGSGGTYVAMVVEIPRVSS